MHCHGSMAGDGAHDTILWNKGDMETGKGGRIYIIIS